MAAAKYLHLTVTLVFLVHITVSVNFSVHRFAATELVSHVVEHNNTYFIGTRNRIFHVDSSLNVLRTLTIGPVSNVDNVVSLMLVSPDSEEPVLFWCGSVQQGLCHVNMLSNINSGDFLDENYYTTQLEDYYEKNHIDAPQQQKLLKHGVYGHLGSTAGNKAMFVDIRSNVILNNLTKNSNFLILSSAVYDGRINRSLPILGYYTLNKTRNSQNYYVKPTFFNPLPGQFGFSWLVIHKNLESVYPIYHIAMFEHRDNVYSVMMQKSSIHGEHFHTRIARFNKTDVRFTSYIEAPVNCSFNTHHYNIAIDAVIGDMAMDVAARFDTNSGDKVLYLLQGEASHSVPYPTINSAVVCALPLKTIDMHFDSEMKRCRKGHGYLAEWYYGREQLCQREVRSL